MKADPKQTRLEKVSAFDPNNNGHCQNGIFGLPFEVDEAQLVLLPVPWDATVSYGEGAAKGPFAIWKASQQLDLCDEWRPGFWKAGYALGALSGNWEAKNQECRKQVKALQSGDTSVNRSTIDQSCGELNQAVYEAAHHHLAKGQFVGLVGGDHSVILGYLRALRAYQQETIGVLQFDAHCDLRHAYEGLRYSHASIMYNALQEGLVDPLVSIGIRDFAEAEEAMMKADNPGIVPFSDAYLKNAVFKGMPWDELCNRIVAELPQEVYVSFDIDGLNPALCPHTGTPVPGGLGFEEARYLLHKITESGRQLIGFDLCEVAPGPQPGDEWDGNVGARILYHLCNELAFSQNLA